MEVKVLNDWLCSRVHSVELPSNWIKIAMDDAFSFLRTNSLSRSKLSKNISDNPIMNIHYGDIHSNLNTDVIGFDSIIKLSSLAEKIEDEKLDFLKKGDVIIADASEDYKGICDCVEIGNIGSLKVVSGLHTFAARPKNEKIVNGFGNYVLKNINVRNELRRISTGISVLGVNKSNIKDCPIFLPPKEEQIKISEILSTWDRAISDNKNLINILKTRKKGLMQHLLTGKIRLKGFSGSWAEQKLGNYFTERRETGFNDLPLLSVGKEGVYPQDTEKKDTSNSDKSKYKRICPMDIGYNTMRMWQGRSALSKIEGIVSPAYTIVTPKESANALFFSYLFQLSEMIYKFYRNSQGMVSDTWMCKFKDFSIIKFQAPPNKKEQDAIADILEKADSEIDKLQLKLEMLNKQKKGLMQQLLTGQKRVKV